MEFVGCRHFGGGAVTAQVVFGGCGFKGSGCGGFWHTCGQRCCGFCIFWWIGAVFGGSSIGDLVEAVFKGVVPSVIFGELPPLISRSISLLGCFGCDGFGWERIHYF